MSLVIEHPGIEEHIDTMQAPTPVQSVQHTTPVPRSDMAHANVACDVLSSGRRVASALSPAEQDGLRRIVREAKAPTSGLRALIALAEQPLHLVAKL